LMAYPPFGNKYEWSDDGSSGLDLDDEGIPGACSDLSVCDPYTPCTEADWVVQTRNFLNDPGNSHINVLLWSWCSINGHNAQCYVDNMETLIAEYPEVTFPFMTGHAEGQGEDMTPDSVYYNNQLIRQHCYTHHRVLFDFADIEAYNPDGAYFYNQHMYDNLDYDGGNWAVQWIALHPGSELAQLASLCSSCAHSDSPTQAMLNCILKARSAWWMWARIAGWAGPTPSTIPANSPFGIFVMLSVFTAGILFYLKHR
jgi:hypothetical protein